MSGNVLFLLNALSTWYMVGLIWMVQLVHYKMFDRVGEDGFAQYATDHARRITPVVAVPMLIEIATAVGLLFSRPGDLSLTWSAVGLGLLGVIWLSTVALQVPAHGKLASGFQADVHASLVATNWIRTIAWSFRGVLVGWGFWTLLPATG